MTLAQSSQPADGALKDGRQSETALLIRRGIGRHLISLNHRILPELTLPTGRRCDIISLSDRGDLWIIEIKSSLADFRADHKWWDYKEWCDRFFFAIAPDGPADVMPPDEGLFVADGFGAHLVRDAQEGRLPAARRKSVTGLVARAAAQRLHALEDPQAWRDMQGF